LDGEGDLLTANSGPLRDTLILCTAAEYQAALWKLCFLIARLAGFGFLMFLRVSGLSLSRFGINLPTQ
jgi:hypothetical protein